MKPLSLALVLAPLLICSCAPTESARRGDATERQYGRALRSVKLPSFPIGQTGTHSFQVSGLENRAYPYKLEIQTTKIQVVEDIPNTPFEDAVFKIEILAGGSVAASKTFHARHSREISGIGRFAVFFWGPNEPRIPFHSSYKVRITVLTPSSREWDTAQIVLR